MSDFELDDAGDDNDDDNDFIDLSPAELCAETFSLSARSMEVEGFALMDIMIALQAIAAEIGWRLNEEK